jgi:hypothetical protein
MRRKRKRRATWNWRLAREVPYLLTNKRVNCSTTTMVVAATEVVRLNR